MASSLTLLPAVATAAVSNKTLAAGRSAKPTPTLPVANTTVPLLAGSFSKAAHAATLPAWTVFEKAAGPDSAMVPGWPVFGKAADPNSIDVVGKAAGPDSAMVPGWPVFGKAADPNSVA